MRAGGDLAFDAGAIAQVSPEAVFKADPDLLLFAGNEKDMKELIGRPGWSEMRAVRAGPCPRRQPGRAPDPRPTHHRRHRAPGEHLPSADGHAMRVWALLILALLLSIVIGAAAGHDWMSPADLCGALAGDTDLRSRLLIDWRLPRVLAAAFVGALLGLGGTVFQGVFRNPLAEPYLLGSAGGAALGATVALLVPLAAPQSLVLPVLAFAGAWGATMLVIGISRVAGAVDAAGMLLAGVAVAAVLGALRSFLMLALSDETVSLQIVLSWVLGGVQTPTWPILGLLAAISVACLALTLMLAKPPRRAGPG